MTQDDSQIIVGRIVGIYGVRGWVKVVSHTDPRENILTYRPWRVRIKGQWRTMEADDGRIQGKGLVAHLQGYDDRDQARELVGSDVAILREQLPALQQGEYYWSDLIGLQVVTVDGVSLGRVDHMIETGANDVLAVHDDRERLIPYIPDVIKEVDLEAGVIRVDWSPEF